MSRALTSGVAAAVAGGHVPVLMLVGLESSAGWLRLNNSGVHRDYGGHTWYGAGNVLQVNAVSENGDVGVVPGMSVQISGIDPAYITTARTEHYQGRQALLYMAPLNADHVLLADPVLVWSGRMDTMTIELGETATITVSAESRLADWDRPRVRRYNGPDQQAVYSGDKGFDYVEEATEINLVWGTR